MHAHIDVSRWTGLPLWLLNLLLTVRWTSCSLKRQGSLPQETRMGSCYWCFFNKLIYFNWRLITLQYCGDFCHTFTWISHGCTDVPHPEFLSFPLPHPILWLSQSTSFGCPASCIELALVIYFTYGNIHVTMLFSQIIPPLPLPHSPKVCSLHLCLFCCFAYRVVVTVFLNSIYMR